MMGCVQWVDEHIATPAEAVKLVNSCDCIVLAHACGEPRVLPRELVKRAHELRGVQIVHMIAMGEGLYCRPEYAESFRHISFFAGAPSREAIWDNRADLIPCFFGRIPSLLGTRMPVDVAMVTVSPPDDKGFCSLGVSVDYTKRAVECARLVIAEVNPTMPRTHGDSFVHVSEIDCFVPVDEPIIELSDAAISDEERRIGEHVAGLIDDGCCLQLGIGGIPDAVLSALTGARDLGIHSEMISNRAAELVDSGVITGRQKTLHKGKIVLTLAMGSRKFYRWLDDNPVIEMHTVDYVNNPYIIAQNRKMVSINSALEVDLLGQVCADTMGPRQYSGVGGQVDFVRGACMSEGGKAIIALPSTARGGQVSRIVALLKQGAVVTTSRYDVDYVVTEHGIAELRGKTARQRMTALINVAAPQFREELERQAFDIYHVQLCVPAFDLPGVPRPAPNLNIRSRGC
jgi:4-hydroxybutyrate CoA-transferase